MDFLSIIGTRPQLVKLKPIVDAFKNKGINHQYIDTGQHYDALLASEYAIKIGLSEPLQNLEVGSNTHARQISEMLVKLEETFQHFNPKNLLIYGDTNSTLAAAIVGARLGVKVIHIEAGLRSGLSSMPEEQNRIVVDHLSNALFAPTDTALINLRKENLEKKSFLVGDVMYDLILGKLNNGKINKVENLSPYAVCTIHRAENTDSKERLLLLFSELSSLKIKVKLFAHPRLLKSLNYFNIQIGNNIEVLEPQEHDLMLNEIYNSNIVLTDSGGLQKESYFLETPCITLRDKTEWPETLVDGANILFTGELPLKELIIEKDWKFQKMPFGKGNAAKLIVDELLKSAL